MPVFEYQGYRADGGKKVSGTIDADTSKMARARLRQQGVLITNVFEDSGAKGALKKPVSSLFNRIRSKDITIFTRQLSTLQAGGLPLMESLNAIIEQTTNVQMKKVVTDIREETLQGSSLGDALEKHPKCFDQLYVNLVRAGEASGALGQTLLRLAEFNEKRLHQQAKLMAAMIYPAIMTVIGGGALIFLLVYVTPKVQTMFEDMNQALPIPTIILLWTSNFLATWWLAIVIGAFAIGLLFYRFIKTEKGNFWFDSVIIKAPVFGELVRISAISRFLRALSVLLSGGVTLVEGLKITARVIGIKPLENAIEQAIVSITEGETLAGPFRRSGLFPPIVTQMMDAGERSGALTETLIRIADSYDFEVETATGALMALVEPVLILAMGLVVGFIVVAILLPIFELSQIAL